MSAYERELAERGNLPSTCCGELGPCRVWFSFETNTLYIDHDDSLLTQRDVDLLWIHLPTTGALWIEHGVCFVQAHDNPPGWPDAPAYRLGEVTPGVVDVSRDVVRRRNNLS